MQARNVAYAKRSCEERAAWIGGHYAGTVVKMISMNQSEEWVDQRLALLRTHVREWKDNASQEAQARKELASKHQTEKEQVRQRGNALEWANCLTLHGERIINLALANDERRRFMKSRQEQETAALEERINQERSRD